MNSLEKPKISTEGMTPIEIARLFLKGEVTIDAIPGNYSEVNDAIADASQPLKGDLNA